MNRFLLLLLVIVACAVGLGFYMNWFNLSTDSGDDKTHITVTVDKNKFNEDEKKAEDKVKGLGKQVKEKVSGPSEKTQDQTSPPVQPPQN